MLKFKSNKSLQPKNVLGVSRSISKIRKYAKRGDPSLLPMEADDISTAKKIKAINPKEKLFLVYPTGGVGINESMYTMRAAARSSSKDVEALIPQNGIAKQSINRSKEI